MIHTLSFHMSLFRLAKIYSNFLETRDGVMYLFISLNSLIHNIDHQWIVSLRMNSAVNYLVSIM